MPSIVARLVPFGAVAVANCINLPYMRRSELSQGMPLEDDLGHVVGYSPKIGKESIGKVHYLNMPSPVNHTKLG